jgi:hypothetical protein
VLSVCDGESESAVQVCGLHHLSKISENDPGCLGACWVGERVAGGASGAGVCRGGAIMMRHSYASRPVRVVRCRGWLVS